MITKETILARLNEATSGTASELYNEVQLDRFASFYVDKWDEDITSADVIAESFTDFWWDSGTPCRRCSICGRLMQEGYVYHDGTKYYCSNDCLHTDFTQEEWEKEYEENECESYYTEWY